MPVLIKNYWVFCLKGKLDGAELLFYHDSRISCHVRLCVSVVSPFRSWALAFSCWGSVMVERIFLKSLAFFEESMITKPIPVQDRHVTLERPQDVFIPVQHRERRACCLALATKRKTFFQDSQQRWLCKKIRRWKSVETGGENTSNKRAAEKDRREVIWRILAY